MSNDKDIAGLSGDAPARGLLRAGPRWRRGAAGVLSALSSASALGVAPFLLFALIFLILPTLRLVSDAFFDAQGHFTLQNFVLLAQPSIVNAYAVSIKISAASAAIGAFLGLLIALSVGRGGLPGWVRSTAMTFSGVASNFAGIPLAFAFLASLGRLGLLTLILRDVFGFDIYRAGFNLLSFWGLTLTYLYFQIPLMVLIIMPAIDGLRSEWREAAETLGASSWQFWRLVGLPILWPNILGTLALLFANSFGAIATAYALTGSYLNIVPILLYAQIRGDVLHNANLGAAMALGMIAITGLANIVYLIVRARAEKWLK
jgi:putative spermidine/putrescine transport system permease protein